MQSSDPEFARLLNSVVFYSRSLFEHQEDKPDALIAPPEAYRRKVHSLSYPSKSCDVKTIAIDAQLAQDTR
jgi:hypothetical protein